MNNIGPGARVFLGAQAPGTEGLRDMNPRTRRLKKHRRLDRNKLNAYLDAGKSLCRNMAESFAKSREGEASGW